MKIGEISSIVLLIQDEGLKLNPYRDTRGFLTGGIGHKMDDEVIEAFDHRWTNVKKEEFWAEVFEEDYLTAYIESLLIMQEYKIDKTEGVLSVLINMVFNLGPAGVRRFPNFLEALSKKDVDKAIYEMKNKSDGSGPSAWYKQVPNRVDRLANIIYDSLIKET